MGEILNSTVAEDGEHVGRFREIGARAREVLLSPNIIAVFVGILISMIPSLKEMLFENTQAALWPLGAALQVRVFWTLFVFKVVSLLSLSAVQDYSTQGFNYKFTGGSLLLHMRQNPNFCWRRRDMPKYSRAKIVWDQLQERD